MCGICGVLRLGDAPIDPTGGLLDRMTDSMAHRGPNDRGVWSDERIGLGHRRLSVIDLSRAGRQPMANETGSVQICFNGEIYNFRELKERFGLERNHRFRSRTDTEVLIHLYEEVGPEMAKLLNGMFAMGIWDARTGELHLVRDPYGVKPLFIQRDGEYFRFASEIKAILADPRVARSPSLQALHDYLTFDYIPGPQTAFDGIEEVPPGHWMTVDSLGRTTCRRYWDVSFDVDPGLRPEDAAVRSLELMRQAVERQLVGDVPIGVMLSGGMDSSTLVALTAEHRSEPFHTFSVGFEDSSFNELPFARAVARTFGTLHHEVTVTAGHVREMLPGYLRFIDEPYADGSAIPTYYVAQEARGKVVVLLSGEGGDEAFAGYDTHAAYRASQWLAHVPRWMLHRLLAPIVFRLPVSHKKLSLEFRLKRLLGGLDLPPEEAHLWWRVVLTEAEKQQIYTAAVRERLEAKPSVRWFRDVYQQPGPQDVLARLQRIDASVFLPDDLMIKNDRMTMAHSLEARVPFTDPDLTEFLSRVPSDVKLPGLRKKAVMRRALGGILPRSILHRKKMGLEMPYSRWLAGELKDLADDYLGPERIEASGLFRPEAIRRLVDQHNSGVCDNGRALWGLLNYMMWLDLYILS